jgi:hypothetical protein
MYIAPILFAASRSPRRRRQRGLHEIQTKGCLLETGTLEMQAATSS